MEGGVESEREEEHSPHTLEFKPSWKNRMYNPLTITNGTKATYS